MRDELEEKKEWITPEIIDLDVKKDTEKDNPNVEENVFYGS